MPQISDASTIGSKEEKLLIKLTGFESSQRYLGRHILSPLMGYGGFIKVELQTDTGLFQGGEFRANLSWQAYGGSSSVATTRPLGHIEIPSMGSQTRLKFKIPTDALPFDSGLLNPAQLYLEVIKKIDGREKVSASTSFPLFLITEDIARKEVWGESISQVTLGVLLLTLLAVILAKVL